MKKTLCLILILAAVCLFALNAFAAGLSFSDVRETDWFAEAVSEAAALGLVNVKDVIIAEHGDKLFHDLAG